MEEPTLQRTQAPGLSSCLRRVRLTTHQTLPVGSKQASHPSDGVASWPELQTQWLATSRLISAVTSVCSLTCTL
jgi:hypothetical protein